MVLILIICSLIGYFFNEIASFLFPSHADKAGELVKLILSVIGGLCIIYGLFISNRRAKATEESVKIQGQQINLSLKSQIDERFKNAIEHLGNGKEPIILGGIAELHQIAKEDSNKYAEVVFNILCSYIRTETNIYTKKADDFNSTVISTIIYYLFKNKTINPYSLFSANLSSSNLYGQDIHNCNLKNANLSFCYLSQVKNSILDGANLGSAKISGSLFENNSMNGVSLFHAKIHLVTFKNTQFKGNETKNIMSTFFVNCKFIDVLFDGLDIYKSIFIGCIFINCSFNNASISHVDFWVCEFMDMTLNPDNLTETDFSASTFYDFNINTKVYKLNFSSCSIEESIGIFIPVEEKLNRQRKIQTKSDTFFKTDIVLKEYQFGNISEEKVKIIIGKYKELTESKDNTTETI